MYIVEVTENLLIHKNIFPMEYSQISCKRPTKEKNKYNQNQLKSTKYHMDYLNHNRFLVKR